MKSEMLTKWRVFPRATLVAYLAALLHTVWWFTGLEDPSNVQLGFVSAIGVIGAGIVWKVYSFFPACKENGHGD